MKKILVTGGAGYIGSHTVVALIEAHYTPIIIDDFSNSRREVLEQIKELTGKEIVLHEGDVADANFLTNVFNNEKEISGVIHFAAHKAVGESVEKPLKYYRNNLNGLMSLLEVMEQQGVTPLVFSSSATVYGAPDSNPITENAEIKASESPYGSTKIIGEQIIKDLTKSGARVSAVTLRYFNPIGAHKSGKIGELPLGIPNNLLPYLTQVAAGKREKLTVYGNDYDTSDGTCIRDYLHVVDLANAHIAALEHLSKQEAPFYDTFNVGTGNGTTVLELIHLFEKVTGIKLNYEIGPKRKGDVPACYADVQKIKNILSWEAGLTLEDALRDAWRWEEELNKVTS